MMKLLVGLGYIIAFAVAVTGVATVLNGAFGCHLSLEGSEAPADVHGGIILLCLALTLVLFLLPFTQARLSKLLRRYKLLILPYLALAALITAVPIYLEINRATPYADAHGALVRGEANFFREPQHIQVLTTKERERLFAETIRHKRADIAKLIAPHLQDLSGEVDVPNAFLAAHTANAEILQLLVARDADLSYKSPGTEEGLLFQLVTGSGEEKDQVKFLAYLARNNLLDVHTVGYSGRTALIAAAEAGHKEVVKKLLQLGARVDQRDDSGNTALLKACEGPFGNLDTREMRRLETIKVLFAAGADGKAKNSSGTSCPAMPMLDNLLKVGRLKNQVKR